MSTVYRIRSFLSSLLPTQRRCSACYRPFHLPSAYAPESPQAAGGSFFCPDCLAVLPKKATGYCPLCGEFQAWPTLPKTLCGSCLKAPPPWSSLTFHGEHSGLLRDLVLQFKFKQALYLAPALIALTLQSLPAPLPKTDLLLPIPLDASRLRFRGYNQALELSKSLLTLRSKKHWRSHWGTQAIVNGDTADSLPKAIRTSFLYRIRKTRPQTGLNRVERQNNMQGTFKAAPQVAGKRILLLDDIMTTGATLRAAAISLHDAGALSVHILTISKTPRLAAKAKLPIS